MINLEKSPEIKCIEDFERKITEEYTSKHAVPLMKDVLNLTEDCADIADPKMLYEHQVSICAEHRFVVLALKAYHEALSRLLSEAGVQVPDFLSLISGSFGNHTDQG